MVVCTSNTNNNNDIAIILSKPDRITRWNPTLSITHTRYNYIYTLDILYPISTRISPFDRKRTRYYRYPYQNITLQQHRYNSAPSRMLISPLLPVRSIIDTYLGLSPSKVYSPTNEIRYFATVMTFASSSFISHVLLLLLL